MAEYGEQLPGTSMCLLSSDILFLGILASVKDEYMCVALVKVLADRCSRRRRCQCKDGADELNGRVVLESALMLPDVYKNHP